MKIFGDDGFRSAFGQKYMTAGFLSAFAEALADFYQGQRLRQPILIGRDTRQSGLEIAGLLQTVLDRRGVQTVFADVLPTPVLSFLLRCHPERYGLGLMITASHNPAEDNGIKIFQPNGAKLDPQSEAKIEEKILFHLEKTGGQDFPSSLPLPSEVFALTDYENFLAQTFPHLTQIEKILIDAAQGATSFLIPKVFQQYPNVQIANNQPNGCNINQNCGALEVERLLKRVQQENFDYGLAFDGDGDRCVAVSRDYGAIETEKLLALFAKERALQMKSDTVVSTEICNKGLEVNLQAMGLKLVETRVGDRNVAEAVLKAKALLGAEPSGHFFFPNLNQSMDGILAALSFLQYLHRHGDVFLSELKTLKHFPRWTQNIPISEGKPLPLAQIRERVQKEIWSQKEKFIIRESMWDPVVRVYYDGYDANRFPALLSIVKESIK